MPISKISDGPCPEIQGAISRLLSNVWCGHCNHETTITNFTGTIKGGDLLLVGQCAECRNEVARVIEGS